MDNGVNNSVEQTIPGVKVAPPNAAPIDAGRGDVGAANSRVQTTDSNQVVQNSIPSSSNVLSTANSQTNANQLVNVNQESQVVNVDSQAASNLTDVKEKKKKKNKGIKSVSYTHLTLPTMAVV